MYIYTYIHTHIHTQVVVTVDDMHVPLETESESYNGKMGPVAEFLRHAMSHKSLCK
jgi:hypothetical protein